MLFSTTWGNKIIKVCVHSNWQPVEFVDKIPKGISIDILKLVEKKLDGDVKFKFVPTASFAKSQEYLHKRKCDVISSTPPIADREDKRLYTKPYLKYKVVVVTKNDKESINGIDEIVTTIISDSEKSSFINQLKAKYRNIAIVETKNELDALRKVSNGEVYCTLTILPILSYYVGNFGLSNLQISGYTSLTYNISMEVREDRKDILKLLDRILFVITEKEYKDIYDKWAEIKLVDKYDVSLYLYGVILVLLMILVFVLRQYSKNINKEKLEKIKAEDLELEVIKEIDKNRNKEKQLFDITKMAQMGEIIGDISYQLQQPLKGISSIANSLKLQNELNLLHKKEIETLANKVIEHTEMLFTTIKIFIDDEKGLKSLPLQESIKNILDVVSIRLNNNKIRLIENLEDTNLVKIEMIYNELSQVIKNIINNSIDALVDKDNGDRIIELSLEVQNDFILLVIEDNGGGIEQDILSKIFNPYFTTKHKTQGVGIGLYIAYDIIVNHMNGDIFAQNTEYGVEFVIKLPILTV